MGMRAAMDVVADKIEEMGIGKRQINYKMRDAGFSRQRYWGEPFPVIYKDGIAYPVAENELPVELPHVEHYKQGEDGEGPLANVTEWVNIAPGIRRETNTMPGYAGSSWYFLRYMDPHNNTAFADRTAIDYWNQVDVYVGGAEHAVGHLLYSRMWTKVLYDLGYIGFDEPYKKIINQGMIGGSSRLVYRVRGTNTFVSHGLRDQYETDPLHVDVNIVDGTELDMEAFRQWKPDYRDAEFILEDGKYICGTLLEKMSKRLFNTVNPKDVVDKYGADTYRMYEMFLGPIEQSKPWETKGIEGVHRFLKKFWRLYADEQKGLIVKDAPATPEELKVLHKTIQKIDADTGSFSYNTAVSQFMICLNELSSLKCNKRSILEPLLILLTPYAPHICAELWQLLGNTTSILDAPYPVFEEQYVKESAFTYPVAVNGKTRTEMGFALDAANSAIEQEVLANEVVKKWMEGKPLKKVVIVKGRMINVVV
jgi:leucyl-tRNA synthetase